MYIYFLNNIIVKKKKSFDVHKSCNREILMETKVKHDVCISDIFISINISVK